MKKLTFPRGGRYLLGGFVVLLLAIMVFAAQDNGPNFSPWSEAVNIGPVVNSSYYDACPTISKSGLSLYFRSNRPGGQGGFDIWVSQRDSLEDPWEAPINLGPTINGPSNEYCSTFSFDGHWMIFVSDRPGGYGSYDLYISHRKDKRDDFGWETPENVGPLVNSSAMENGPCLFNDGATGQTLLYYSSGRPGGLGGLDIYVSLVVLDKDGIFVGPPSPVAELNTSYPDYQPALRKDGLEIFFASYRPGGIGGVDLWASIRETTLDLWSPPVNLGSLVNSTAYDFHPTLSWDGTTLTFASERAGGEGQADLYMCTRTKLKGPEK